MNLYLADSGAASNLSTIPFIRRILAESPSPISEVEEPGDADMILFSDVHLQDDWNYRNVLSNPITRRYPDRIAVYNERDRPWCALPGVYVSMPASRFQAMWQVAGSYWLHENPASRLGSALPDGEPSLLYSFVGSPTHRCRQAIMKTDHLPDSHVELVDGFVFYDPDSKMFEQRRRRFAEILFDSRFVLCPRGTGTSSFRLYEVLAAGRVPVIISDQWRPPEGPRWDDFAIRWPEGRVGDLPRFLAEASDRYRGLQESGRVAYETWFRPEAAVIRQLLQLQALLEVSRSSVAFPSRGFPDVQYARSALGHVYRSSRRLSR